MPVCPLPVQSPTSGTQPGAPNWKGVMSGAPALLELRRYQVMVAESTAPTVAVPSPFQSPTTGAQPGAPNWKAGTSVAPGPLLPRRYQVAVAGSKAPR